MSCSRNGCDNIMCDTYVDHAGYICRDCQEEFKNWVKADRIQIHTEGEAITALRIFMDEEKCSMSFSDVQLDLDEFFSEYRV